MSKTGYDDDLKAWRLALERAFGHEVFGDYTPELSTAVSTVHGLSCALETLMEAHSEMLQAVGFHDARDFVECLVSGADHPLLDYWAKVRKPPARQPKDRLTRLHLSGLADLLARATNPSTKQPYGITAARQIVSESLADKSTDITPEALRNALNAEVELRARKIRAEWKAQKVPGSKLASRQQARAQVKAELDAVMSKIEPFLQTDLPKYSAMKVSQFFANYIVQATQPVTSGIFLPPAEF